MTRNEFYVHKRLAALNPDKEVVMDIHGDYRVTFAAQPDVAALAALGFEIVKQTGRKFVLHDTTPPTHPLIMTAAEQSVYDTLTAHYGHIGSVSASADHGFVVSLMGGKLDDEFLADVVRKTGLLIINHNGSSFTVRDHAGQDAFVADLNTSAIIEPPIKTDDTRPVEPISEPDAPHETALDVALDAVLAKEGIELDAVPLDAGDALPVTESDDTAWATAGLRAALTAVLAVHEFYPAEIHPTVATHHWLIENRGRKETLRGRLEDAGLAVVRATQDFMGDSPYSYATVYFDGTPDLVTPMDEAAVEEAATADQIASLRTCVSVQNDMLQILEGRLAEAHAINQAQSKLIRDAILPTLEAKPTRVEVCTLDQSLNGAAKVNADAELARELSAGWQVLDCTISFTDEAGTWRVVTLIREVAEQPQPEKQAVAEAAADALFSQAARNGAPAPAPRPSVRIIEESRPLEPALNRIDLGRFPHAARIHNGGLDAWAQDRNAEAIDAVQRSVEARQAARNLATPTIAPNPFRIPSSVGGRS